MLYTAGQFGQATIGATRTLSSCGRFAMERSIYDANKTRTALSLYPAFTLVTDSQID